MNTMSGVIASGKAQAVTFTQLPWLRAQFRQKFGFDPYPGTVNVKLDKRLSAGDVSGLPWVAIEPGEQGYCAARALRVEVNGRASAVWLLPDVAGYPADQIELMADRSLRGLLGLKDGDRITIRIPEGGA